MRKFPYILIAMLCIFVHLSALMVPAGGAEYGGKIAFLKKGDIWFADQDGRNIRRATDTGGKIEDFLFSPSLSYVAYSQKIKTVDEPGLWEKDEKPPRRSVCTIIVKDLRSPKIIYEMVPPDGEWIYLDKWMPNERLLGHSSSGFDVSGFFVLEALNGRRSEPDYSQGRLLVEADFSLDGVLQAYVRDSGVGKDYMTHLYLLDLKTKTEKLLLSKRSVLSPKISSDKSRIAFFEVEEKGEKNFDNLWIYDLRKELLKKLYEGPAKPKFGGVSDLAWSPDGRHVAVFFPSETRVLEIENPTQSHRIRGTDFSWVSNHGAIYLQGDRVYRYGLDTRKADLFLENATKPVYLRPR